MYSCGKGEVTTLISGFGVNLHPLSLKNFGFSSYCASTVLFLSSFDQVSLGTAYEQELSIAKLLIPLAILKNPFSPQ